MKRDQLKFFPFYVTFKSEAVSTQTTNSSDEARKTTGFTIDWFLNDSNGSQLTEKLPPRLEDWTQKALTPNYEQPFLAQMAQLARQLRLQNMTKERVLEKVIQKKLKYLKILQEDLSLIHI